ncbi:MAG TPA: hypothetical protein VGH44_01510 [Candidatus Saccharimonadia bacterium]
MIIIKNDFRVKEALVPSDKVIFLFTAMGTRIGAYPYRFFVKQFNKRGYSCVVYDYPRRIVFSGDTKLWRRFFNEIVTDGQERVKMFKKQGVTHFYSYGVSMGTLCANKFTRDTPEISHVVLNLTYGDVARNIWTFKSVKKAKLSLLGQGIDEEAVRREITYLDPVYNAAGLIGRRVMLQLAKRDKIFPYDQTKYTKLAFEAAELDMVYSENKFLSHLPAATKNLLSISSIDKFFSS